MAPWEVPLWALWIGLVGGLIEVAILMFRKVVLHHAINPGPDVVWMAPVACAVLLVGPAMILALAVWRLPRWVGLRVAVWGLSFAGFLGPLLLFRSLVKYAVLILAAGLASVAARAAGAHPRSCRALVRRTTPALVVLLALLAVGMHGWRAVAERRAVAQLPRAPANAPNVLLIVMDAVRAHNLSLYGYHRETTPHLERWAAQGTVFENAIATAPWTLPSHASMFTGRYPHELSADWDGPLDDAAPTLAETLAARGYLTAGFPANTVYCSAEHGLDRGFVHYEDFTVSAGQILGSSSVVRRALNEKLPFRRLLGYHDIPGRQNAADVNASFLQWLSQTDGRPFFAFLNYFDAHEPYLPPPPFDSLFGSTGWQGFPARFDRKPSPEETKAWVDAYDGAIAYADRELDALLQELERRGLLANTLVIITSDHGEEFGEHDVCFHGYSAYRLALRVPLVILFGQHVPRGRRIPASVSLRDLPGTVMELLGAGSGSPLPGESLSRFWTGRRRPGTTSEEAVFSRLSKPVFAARLPPWYPITQGAIDSLHAWPYHYLRNEAGQEELYRIDDDPLERHNVAHRAQDRDALDELRSTLDGLLDGEAHASKRE
jgi:arylsulfatase A-like enzyme